jgi:hypothetical protein
VSVRRPPGAVAIAALAVLVVVASPAAAAADEPVRIAAIGDSITRGTNAFGWYGDHPSVSWSTGFNPIDGLSSHYERLIRDDPWSWPRELNVSEAGATMADAPAQAREVVDRGADYVTFLLGANDLCAASPAEMTPLGSFRADLDEALSILERGLPDARVLVASIPDLHALWQVFHDRPLAGFVWASGRTCPSMLDPSNTPHDRFHVVVREVAYNLVLADVCADHRTCVFDDFAVFRHPIAADEVSPLDFFHPSLRGQRTLAALTWESAWTG